jgi:hypothetical protein
MKKFIYLLITALFLSVNLFAQDDRLDDFSFDEEPLQEESVPYFALGGGGTVNFAFVNYDDINSFITSAENNTMLDEMDGQMLTWGFEIFTGVVFVPNMRAGYYYTNGAKISSKDVDINGTMYNRNLEFRALQHGINLEYAWSPVKSFAFVPGVGIGWGTIEMNYYQSRNGEIYFTDYGNPDELGNNFWQKMSRGNFHVNPRITVEYAVNNFAMVRGSASYNHTFSQDWQLNGNAALKNVPDGINPSGISAQIGIFFGLFNY